MNALSPRAAAALASYDNPTPAQRYMIEMGFAPDNLCWTCSGSGQVPLAGTWQDRECFHCSGQGFIAVKPQVFVGWNR